MTQPTSFKVSSPGFPSFAGRTCNVLESSAISRERGRGAQHGTGTTHSRSPTCPDQIVGWSQTTVTNAAFDSKKEKQIEEALENAHQGITRLAGRRNTQNSLHPLPARPTSAPVVEAVETILLAQVSRDPDHQVRRLHHHHHQQAKQHQALDQKHVHNKQQDPQHVTIPPHFSASASARHGRTGWAQRR